MNFPLIAMPGGAEWLIILAIVILVFGAAKLPELARGTGQALRIFKAETKGLVDGDDDDTPKDKKAKKSKIDDTAAREEAEAEATPAELPPAGSASDDGTLTAEQVEQKRS